MMKQQKIAVRVAGAALVLLGVALGTWVGMNWSWLRSDGRPAVLARSGASVPPTDVPETLDRPASIAGSGEEPVLPAAGYLRWRRPDPMESRVRPIAYHVRLNGPGENMPTSFPVVGANRTDLALAEIDGLVENERYEWEVVGHASPRFDRPLTYHETGAFYYDEADEPPPRPAIDADAFEMSGDGSVVLRWEAARDPDPLDEVRYEVLVSVRGVEETEAREVAGPTLALPPARPGSSVAFRVRTLDRAGNASEWTKSRTFRTPYGPLAVPRPQPAEPGATLATDDMLVWSEVSSPDPELEVAYEVELMNEHGTGSRLASLKTFGTGVRVATLIGHAAIDPATVTSDQTYRWRVRALVPNENVASPYSELQRIVVGREVWKEPIEQGQTGARRHDEVAMPGLESLLPSFDRPLLEGRRVTKIFRGVPEQVDEATMTPLREVRIRNPNDYTAAVGLRVGHRGRDFTVSANDTASVHVPEGDYSVYFVRSDRPDRLLQGDNFTLKGQGVVIHLVGVAGGNYNIKEIARQNGGE